MADKLNGLIFSEFLADNSQFAPGYDTDGDGQHNKSDEYIELQNTSGSAISLEGFEVWSEANGLLYSFGAADTIAPGQTATIVGEYSGTPPSGFYDAGLSDGGDFLEDGEGAKNDTIYLVDTSTGDYIVFSYGDPALAPSPPPGFPGTSQIGAGESIDSGAPNGVAFIRDADGNWVEGSADPGNPGFVCYASGTLIGTPDGARAVEQLAVGDLIETLDHGPQPIHWVRCSDQSLEKVSVDEKPVLIVASALGAGLPTHDLVVSPQHRILVGGGGQLEGPFKSEAFASAKSLTSLPGIRHMNGKTRSTWVHFACARHEVITANGCLSETLLLGRMVLNGLTRLERWTLTSIFGPTPLPGAVLNGPPARACLKVGEARRMLAEYAKEKEQRTQKECQKWDRDRAMEKYEVERMHNAQSLAQSSTKATYTT